MAGGGSGGPTPAPVPVPAAQFEAQFRGRDVAFKVVDLSAAGSGAQDALRRAVREAKVWASASLRCRNVCTMLGYARDGAKFGFVVERFRGGTLEDAVSAGRAGTPGAGGGGTPGAAGGGTPGGGGMPAGEVLRVLRALLEALADCHAQDPPVVHFDVKPANLLVGGDGRVALTDFGIAGVVDAMATHTATFLGTGARAFGTFRYAAPEQLDPRRRGSRGTKADMWAVAATASHMLTGRAPFHGLNVMEIGVAVLLHGETPEIPGGALPAGVEEALRRCFEQDPGGRPSAAELLGVVEEAADAGGGVRGELGGAAAARKRKRTAPVEARAGEPRATGAGTGGGAGGGDVGGGGGEAGRGGAGRPGEGASGAAEGPTRAQDVSSGREVARLEGQGGLAAAVGHLERQFGGLGEAEKRAVTERMLPALVVAEEPLSVAELKRLVRLGGDAELDDGVVARAVGSKGSLFPTGEDGLVRPFHKSVLDWLGDEKGSGEWYVAAATGHRVHARTWRRAAEGVEGEAGHGRCAEVLGEYGAAFALHHVAGSGDRDAAVAMCTNLELLRAGVEAGAVKRLIVGVGRCRAALARGGETGGGEGDAGDTDEAAGRVLETLRWLRCVPSMRVWLAPWGDACVPRACSSMEGPMHDVVPPSSLRAGTLGV